MTIQRLPNNALDILEGPGSQNMRRRVIEILNQLIQDSGDWTPVIRGSGTAGTYEIATNKSRWRRSGNTVFLDLWIQLASGITAGGTGNVLITGAPYNKKAGTLPQGTLRLDNVGFTANSHLVLSHSDTNAAVASLILIEIVSNSGANAVPISALAADDLIIGSICFETDDP